MADSAIASILATHSAEILDDWVGRQQQGATFRSDLMSAGELRQQSDDFLRRFRAAAERGGADDVEGAAWEPVRDMLSTLSRARAMQGFSPTETATFILSFKQPLFTRLRDEMAGDPARLAEETWRATRRGWPRRPGAPPSCWTAWRCSPPRPSSPAART